MDRRRRAPPNGKQRKERHNAIVAEIDALDFHPEVAFGDDLINRIVRLAVFSETVADAQSTIAYDREIGRDLGFDNDEKMQLHISSLCADVGKTGPLHATREQQILCIRMYDVENVDGSMTVSAFFRTYMRKPWSSSMPHRLVRPLWFWHLEHLFRGLRMGSAKTVTMRAFWNQHTVWTLQLLETPGSGIPKRAIPAAACHHRVRGDNPDGILNDDDSLVDPDRFTDEHVDRDGTVVRLSSGGYEIVAKTGTVTDEYNAYRRRSALNYEQAILGLTVEILVGRGGAYSTKALAENLAPKFADARRDPVQTQEFLESLLEEAPLAEWITKITDDEFLAIVQSAERKLKNLDEDMR